MSSSSSPKSCLLPLRCLPPAAAAAAFGEPPSGLLPLPLPPRRCFGRGSGGKNGCGMGGDDAGCELLEGVWPLSSGRCSLADGSRGGGEADASIAMCSPCVLSSRWPPSLQVASSAAAREVGQGAGGRARRHKAPPAEEATPRCTEGRNAGCTLPVMVFWSQTAQAASEAVQALQQAGRQGASCVLLPWWLPHAVNCPRICTGHCRGGPEDRKGAKNAFSALGGYGERTRAGAGFAM